MTALLSHQAFLPDMMERQNQNDIRLSSIYGGYDPNGLSFSPDHQWTDLSWTQYQTVPGAQDFQSSYPGTVAHTYRQASKSGAGVQTSQNAQEFEEYALQAATAQYGSQHNSPAFSAADVASLHSSVSLETGHSSNLMNLSNCSPSIPDMDGAYTFGEFDMETIGDMECQMWKVPSTQHGYPASTGVASPGAFSTAMSRGNSSLGNMQQFHQNSPSYVASPDFALFQDESHVQTQAPHTTPAGKGGRRRNQPDSNNAARSHPYYHNAEVGPDGLYHCPWENDSPSRCQHKPEKLKCNYDKCIDSHLKPYRCKMSACLDAKFSSTACLLRHEREAHAMHGHGEKPYSCELSTCDRSVPGNGFPRHWNLCDHMHRVHGMKATTLDRGKNKGSRKRKNATTDAPAKKPRATKSLKKEENSPPMSATCPEDEKTRRVIKALDQLDRNDPKFLQKLNQAGIYVT